MTASGGVRTLLGLGLAVSLAASGSSPASAKRRTVHAWLGCDACLGAGRQARACSPQACVDSELVLESDGRVGYRLAGAAGTIRELRAFTGRRMQVTGLVDPSLGTLSVERFTPDHPGLQDDAPSALEQPRLELDDLDGTPRSLGELRGKIVVVNFWATWCGPCRAEMPELDRVHRAYQKAGLVVVVGAASDGPSSADAVRRLVVERGVGYPIWLGANGSDLGAFGFGSAIPATAILDRDGRVSWRREGVVREAELRRQIDRLLVPTAGGH